MEHTDEKIYSILLEVKEDLGELKSGVSYIKSQADRTNGRVNKLETAENIRTGKMAIVGMIASAVTSVIITVFFRRL